MKWMKQALLLLAGLMLALPAWAQRPGRHYDPKNVVTVQGQVEKVEPMSRPGRRGGEGKPGQQTQVVHLKTDQGIMLVHLGPAKFLEEATVCPQGGGHHVRNRLQTHHRQRRCYPGGPSEIRRQNRDPAGRPGNSGLARSRYRRPAAFSRSQCPGSAPIIGRGFQLFRPKILAKARASCYI